MLRKITLFIIACLAINLTAFAQADKRAVFPSGAIDGSANPELIPDIVAYRLFFSVVDEGPQSVSGSSANLSAKQKAKLSPIQLNDTDQQTICETLSAFKGNLVNAVAGKSGASSSPSLDDVTQNALNALKSKMSSDGFQRLKGHVQEQKKYMKIVPFPQMSEHNH